MPFSSSAGDRTDLVVELDRLDRDVIALLKRRVEMAMAMDATSSPTAVDEHESRAMDLYRGEFGGPGELLARAVLNLCGIKRRPPQQFRHSLLPRMTSAGHPDATHE
ncbi:hypothetical protein [Streptomyces fuscichromogenes]|uniref:Chorismate mutase n=1 Tax=Streptomyces fuscichromogenes TaxID=1324013 RepID=A0A918CQ71_9ACTN|nr:hypothetical protein [Streptomyces fuscichromogenes]GGM98566.1 hypothetical protein GCM10011578_019500 [Streptomyces fuscichromogenes]